MKKIALWLLPLSLMASDLQDIVRNVQSNEMMQSLDFALQAQTKGRNAVVANYLPKVKGNYMYQYLEKAQRGLFDPEQTASIEASAIIFDGFRRSETIMAQNSKIDATQMTKEYQKEQLTLNAVTLYFSLQSIQANIEAKEQKQKQLTNELMRLERFYKANSVTQDKVEQMRAALAMTEYEVTFLKQNFSDLALNLESLTGTKLEKIVNASLIEKISEPETLRADIKSLEYEIESLDHDAKTKTAEYWPTVLVKDTYTATKYYPADLPASFSSALSLPTATNKIQIVASMTFFDFFAKSCERQATEMQKQAKKSELEYKKRDVDLRKRFATIQLNTVKEKIRSSTLSMEASKKSFDFIAKQLEANLVDSTTYLDAATQYYNAKAMLIGAENEYQIALANYYFNNAIPLMEMIK